MTTGDGVDRVDEEDDPDADEDDANDDEIGDAEGDVGGPTRETGLTDEEGIEAAVDTSELLLWIGRMSSQGVDAAE